MQNSEHLLNTLYAAPSKPKLWGDVLESCIDMVGAESGWVCELDRRDCFAGSGFVRRMDEGVQDRYFDHFASCDPFRIDLAKRSSIPLGVWGDETFIAKDDLVRSEFYADFMTPIGVHSISIVRMLDDGDVIRSMHLNYGKRSDRAKAIGQPRLQELFPHFRRASLLSRELRHIAAREEASQQIPEISGEYVILLDRRGCVSLATRAAEILLSRGTIISLKHEKLYVVDTKQNDLLQALIKQAIEPGKRLQAGGFVKLTGSDNDLALVTVSPLEFSSRCIDAVALLTIRISAKRSLIEGPHLLTKYDLTPAQRRIAFMLANGSSPRQIACKLGISYNTTRNHLKQIYLRLNVNRQSELVTLLLKKG